MSIFQLPLFESTVCAAVRFRICPRRRAIDRYLRATHSPLIEHFKRAGKRRIVGIQDIVTPTFQMHSSDFSSATDLPMDGSRQFHLSLPLPAGFFSAFRLHPTYAKIRIATGVARQPCVSCASRRYLHIYTIEKTFLSR